MGKSTEQKKEKKGRKKEHKFSYNILKLALCHDINFPAKRLLTGGTT